jgi:hypothetical protein
MLSAGYYYNLTFVQIGLEDFGRRWLALSPQSIAADMALFALLTCLAALAGGYWMQRHGWGWRFRLKLRLAFFVVMAQTTLTAICPLVRNEVAFLAWLSAAAAALGLGVPALFSMAVDLIPVGRRGLVAGLVTALAYFAAETFSTSWTFEAYRAQVLVLTAGAALSMPMLYALAVSLYTVLNFALWADLSTPDTICMRSALGVALSAWTATFLSTALAIYLQGSGVSLEQHIQIVDALAMLFFTVALTLAFFRKPAYQRTEEFL